MATAQVQAFYLSVLKRLGLSATWLYRLAASRITFGLLRVTGIWGLCLSTFMLYGWLSVMRMLCPPGSH